MLESGPELGTRTPKEILFIMTPMGFGFISRKDAKHAKFREK
jgi:hypothetical protein